MRHRGGGVGNGGKKFRRIMLLEGERGIADSSLREERGVIGEED